MLAPNGHVMKKFCEASIGWSIFASKWDGLNQGPRNPMLFWWLAMPCLIAAMQPAPLDEPNMSKSAAYPWMSQATPTGKASEVAAVS